MPEHIGNKIKKIRDSAKLSQARFGYKVGVSGKTISSYERGIVNPSSKMLEKISETYSIPLVFSTTDLKETLKIKLEYLEEQISELRALISESIIA